MLNVEAAKRWTKQRVKHLAMYHKLCRPIFEKTVEYAESSAF
jgi:hypothetical protein